MAAVEPFARSEMIGPAPPPPGQRGLAKWLRENLFSSVGNAILTVIGLAVVYAALRGVVPWLANGVWQASSLPECREIIAAEAGPGASGACWAVIRERWHQFVFGLYPQWAYWRPILAFGLLFAALAPVLYSGMGGRQLRILAAAGVVSVVLLALAHAPGAAIVAAAVIFAALLALAVLRPGRLVLFTGLYPAMAYFLLWGGSVWGPVAVLLGLGVLGLVYLLLVGLAGVTPAAVAGLVAACLWWLFAVAPLAGALQGALPLAIEFIPSDEFGGFLLAILIGVTAIGFSLPLGILLALGRQSDLPIVKAICVGFIEFIRGVPLITLLFTASLLLGYFLPPGTTFDVILRVMILVTFFAAAYLAEVIRGGLAALPRGQFEAADALGLDYWRAQRLVIMPQALKISIPGIVSTFIGLFKDTTLVSFVALYEPLRSITNAVRADMNWKGIYWEPYIFVGAIFFVICFGMSRYSMYLERKLRTDHR